MISESTISLAMTKRMEQPARTQKHIVAWDFFKRPSGTFYRVINEELGKSHPGGDYELGTQTKKLPSRQSYGLNDMIGKQVRGWVGKGKTVTALVTRIRIHLADIRLESPQTQFRHHCFECFTLGLRKNHATGLAQDHSHFGLGRDLYAQRLAANSTMRLSTWMIRPILWLDTERRRS